MVVPLLHSPAPQACYCNYDCCVICTVLLAAGRPDATADGLAYQTAAAARMRCWAQLHCDQQIILPVSNSCGVRMDSVMIPSRAVYFPTLRLQACPR